MKYNHVETVHAPCWDIVNFCGVNLKQKLFCEITHFLALGQPQTQTQSRFSNVILPKSRWLCLRTGTLRAS